MIVTVMLPVSPARRAYCAGGLARPSVTRRTGPDAGRTRMDRRTPGPALTQATTGRAAEATQWLETERALERSVRKDERS